MHVAGVEYDIPTTMAVLAEAEQAAGVSLMEELANQRYTQLLQGTIYAGLKSQGVKEIDGKVLSFALIGEVSDFFEAQQNLLAFMMAMAPDVPAGAPAKNAPKRTPKS